MKTSLWMAIIGSVFASLSNSVLAAPQVMGYYPNWATYERHFQPEDIQKTGALAPLTVGLYAFAQIGNCAPPYASDSDPDLCNSGTLATGTQDYRLYSTDPYSDFHIIPHDYHSTGASGKGNMGKFISLFHAQKKMALLSIGGYSLSVPFFKAIDSQHQSTFISSIIQFLNQVKQDNQNDGFDGVDIDWEPNDNAWTFLDQTNAKTVLGHYLSFMQNLRQALSTEYYPSAWLTGAFPANPATLEKIEAIQPGFLSQLSQTVNYMNIMAYDYHGAFDVPKITNLNAPLYFDTNQPATTLQRNSFNVDTTIQTYKRYVPANKLVLGIGLYGRAVNGVSPSQNGLYQPFSGVPNGEWDNTGVYDYKFIINNLLGKGFTGYSVLDPQGKRIGSAAYCLSNCPITLQDLSGTNTFIAYDSTNDAHNKGAYAKDNGLGGLMFWSLDGDIPPNDPSGLSLINAATATSSLHLF